MTVERTTDLLSLAREIGPDLVALRRELHRIPEIGNDLPLTQQARAARARRAATVEVIDRRGAGLVVGRDPWPETRARAGPDDPVVLLRGDMDALPVTEEVAVDYVSEHAGVMHACGHDLHVAGLVGAARLLLERRDELAGDVVLMFQPGEEGPGGAEPMIAEGLLDAAGRPVDAAYALHVASSEYPLGQWFGRPGPVYAAADEVRVRVVGVGGHGSLAAPREGPDPGGLRDGRRAADDDDPRLRRLRPGRGHGRPDRRRHEGEHHPGHGRVRRDRPQPLGHERAPRCSTTSSAWPAASQPRTGSTPRSTTGSATR